jgi:serine phosphatase RsbU (regulator of sigma subunit)
VISASGRVRAVESDRPAAPLGLRALSGEAPRLQRLPFAVGDQLLCYTDGVTEARDHTRAFYPLADGVARHVCEDPARTLTALHDELLDHVGGRLHDDAALLLLRKTAAEEPDRATASYETALRPYATRVSTSDARPVPPTG